MPHNSTLVQSGTNFYVVAEDGGSTELVEPSTVTITDDRPPRFEVNKVHAIVVNSVDQPLIVDDNGIVLFFSPLAPTAAPTVAVGSGGALTGVYQVKYTFAIRDLDENIVAESGFSTSASVTLTADKLAVSNLQLLTGLTAANYDDRYEVVRRVYRTAAGGSTYFLWYTVEDNTTTNFEDDTSDAAISAIAADSLSTIPFLSHIASFHDRMFGVDDSTDRERLLYSEAGLRWAWPTDNFFQMPQVKGDAQSGITALMPRKDALGIAKSSMLISLTGTDDSDFRITILSTTIGCVSQETCASYNDNWYFLGQDGVYRWGEDGLTCISDGKVRSWFTTDDYFDRNEFPNAYGVIDVITKSYRLFLAPANDIATFTHWVEFDIENGTWWGPHNTSGYSFTSAFRLGSHNPLVGFGSTDGYIAVDSDDPKDGDTAIEIESITTPIKAADPPQMTYYGQFSIEIAPQSGGTFVVYPTVGELEDSEEQFFTQDLTDPSTTHGRLGYGRYIKFRVYRSGYTHFVQILGFEVNPVNIVGRRE